MAIAVNATRRAADQVAMGFNGGFNVFLTSAPTNLSTMLLTCGFSDDSCVVNDIADPYGNVWVQVFDSGNHSIGLRTQVWMCTSQHDLVAGTVIRVNCTNSTFVTATWALDEATGLGGAHVPDVSSTAFNGSAVGTFSIGPTSATGYADELLWSVICTPANAFTTQSVTPDTGWTLHDTRATGPSGCSLYTLYKIVSATGAQTASGTIDTTASKWTGGVAGLPATQTLRQSAGFAGVEAAYTTPSRSGGFVGVEVAYVEGTPPPPTTTARRPMPIIAG